MPLYPATPERVCGTHCADRLPGCTTRPAPHRRAQLSFAALAFERFEHAAEFLGQGHADGKFRIAVRPLECDGVGMQKHAVETQIVHVLVEAFVAVPLVARDGMFQVCGVRANLMGSAGPDANLHERRRIAELLDGPELAQRRLALRIDAGANLAGATIGAERLVDFDASELPIAPNQRQVPLLDAPFAQQLVQLAQSAAPLGDEQAARCRPIQSMHELERLEARPETPQCLDTPQVHAAAAVYGEPGRLVDDEYA